MKRRWILFAAILLGGFAILHIDAGQLEPPGPVAPTMHGLGEIGALGDAVSPLVFDDQLGGVADLRSEVYIRLTVDGEDLDGDVSVGQYIGWSRVFGADFHGLVPYDPVTGIVTSGRRFYDPLIVRMNIESIWPQIYQAVTDHRVVNVARLEWVRPDLTAPYYAIEITDGRIAGAEMKLVPTPTGQAHILEVTFTFSTIELESDGAMAIDDWNAGGA